MSATEGFLWTLQRRKSYDWLKSDDDFIKLLEKMKKNTIKFLK